MNRAILKLRSRQLVVRTRYRARSPVIPLGCWCHPAEVLKLTGMRRASFPFDWLATHPAHGIAYANSNIETEFDHFVRDLTRNDAGNVVSKHYPGTEFLHYGELISNTDQQQKLIRRSQRFLDFFHKQPCTFLYSLTSVGLGTHHEVEKFLESVNAFHRLSAGRHQLAVYICHEESTRENSERCDAVQAVLAETDNTRVVTYVRHVGQFGIWGDPQGYPTLLRSMGIRIVPTLPLVRWESREAATPKD